ncbi:MAG TPA: hypothetical protein VER33_13060 [Polyangiaceae bacterium]|nr:hypothetical protein [Polyangiaceae bacterium]
MPCLLGLLGLFFPRLVLVLVWFFVDGYLARAFGHWVWPLLGFLFLPLTTLAFAYSRHSLSAGGELSLLGWLLTLLALIIDVGIVRGGHRSRSRRLRTD